MTYSIVAYDSQHDQLGVAVQSHWFNVGSVVPWAEPGVGAIATQSFAEVSYGPLGLALMRAGKPPEQALAGLLAADPGAATRQVAMVDAQGRVATHTGARCVAAAGHRMGVGFSAQANLMAKDTVWGAMAAAFERTPGDLAERMVVALEAAEAEGGDIRGRQSAALLVVSARLLPAPWQGRVFDLRVEDHPQPLRELRRALAIARAYQHAEAGEQLLQEAGGDEAQSALAAAEYQQAIQTPELAGNPELVFWYGVALATAGRVEEALPHFQSAFSADPSWRELVPRLVPAGLLPDDPALIGRIVA
ncbi:MAG: DUF1028 domain-containing protein [Chloroflexi bacterium]|nr:DUF1028 domain-containing protein [Chloroflexota bacterium]